MSKNVLIISASPRRKGNSDLLCDQFMQGAQEAGYKVEKIFMREKKVNFCYGCGACADTGKCVQKDDMAEVLDKMVEAEVLVFATPVYFYSIDGQLKTLIDRTVSRYRELKGKAYFIATLADKGKKSVEGTVTAFRGFLSCLDNVEEAGMIIGFGAWNVGDILKNPAMKQAYESGKNI